MLEHMFHVYVDFTIEECPRAFYVGKGTSRRVKSMKRNAKHSNICRKHGVTRVVVLSTELEQEAFVVESVLIQCLRTRHGVEGHWGANLTDGGEGPSGRVVTDEQRRRISESKRGQATWMRGRRHSEDALRAIGEASRGRRHTDETRACIGASQAGRTQSIETRERIRQAALERWARKHSAVSISTPEPCPTIIRSSSEPAASMKAPDASQPLPSQPA